MANQEYSDVTKTGPIGLKGLKGVTRENRNDILNQIHQQNLQDVYEIKRGAYGYNQVYNPNFGKVGRIAAPEGFGESKYDTGLFRDISQETIQNNRALQQGFWAELGSGILKGGVIVATTFADGIVGSLIGVGNIINEALQGNIDSAGDALNAFVDNPFSKLMEGINSSMEELVPNYYSTYEQNRAWYENIFTGNFLGDKLLKNVGFMVGAAGAAAVTGGVGAKFLVKKGLRDAFKGTVTTATGKALDTGSDIYKAYKSGDAVMDGAKLTKDLGKAAKQLKNAEMRLQLAGSINSAMGEARIEAIGGANEYGDKLNQALDQEHAMYKDNLLMQMYQNNPEYFSIDQNGNISLTDPNGLAYYNDMLAKEQQHYEQSKAKVNEQAAKVGNSIFLLNLPLIAGSNIWQYGRYISGGYTANKTFNNLVNGSIKEGFTKNKWAPRLTRLKAASSPLMEFQEEMTQSAFSKGSMMWQGSKANDEFGEFYGSKLDQEADAEAKGWFNSILKGLAQQYGDINNYEEGVIGLITGGLSGFVMPKFSRQVDDKGEKIKGWKGLKFEGFGGEMFEGFRDAKQQSADADAMVEAMNKRIQDPEFINLYQSTIRHNALQRQMDEAAENGDRFEYKNKEQAQIVSDAIMFDKAGKLQDLYEMIEEGGTVSDEKLEELKQIINKRTGRPLYENKSDDEIRESVKKQADDHKKAVDKYVEISRNLKTLYGERVSQDVLEELTYGFTQIDNWETRARQIAETLRKPLIEKAQEIKDRWGIDIDTTLKSMADLPAQFMKDDGLLNEIISTIQNKNLTVQQRRRRIDASIKARQREIKSNKAKLTRKVQSFREEFAKRFDKLEKQKQTRIEDYKKSVITTLERQLQELDKLEKEIVSNMSKKKRQKKESFYAASKSLITDTINKIKNGSIDPTSDLSSILGQISNSLDQAEDAFYSENVIDKRFKRGYNPKYTDSGRTVEGENISEAELEERRSTIAKNRDLVADIMKLKDRLSDPNNQLMSQIDAQSMAESLSDFVNIWAMRDHFIDTYQALSDNPGLMEDRMQEKIKKMVENYQSKLSDELLEKVKSVTTVQELRDLLDKQDNEVIDNLLDKIAKSDNDLLKSIAEEYANIEDIRQLLVGPKDNPQLGGVIGKLFDQYNDSNQQMAIIEALNNTIIPLVDNAKKASDIYEEIEKLAKDETDPFMSTVYNELADLLKDAAKSASTKKRDSTKSKPVDTKSEPEKDKKKSKDDEDNDDNSSSADDNASTDDDNDAEDDAATPPIGSNPESNDDGINSIDTSNPIIRDLNNKDDDELKEIISAKDDDPILKDAEKENVDKTVYKAAASIILSTRDTPAVESSTEEVVDDDSNAESSNRGVANSNHITDYNIDDLKDKTKRKAVRYNDKNGTAQALRSYGAYDFVDQGYLAYLLRLHEDLKVQYIRMNVKGLSNLVTLAIEVTSEIEQDLKKAGWDRGYTTIDGKKYQIIGTLGFRSGDKAAADNYNAVKKFVDDATEGTKEGEGKLSGLENTISHIYSGRMVKSDETHDVEERDLEEVLNRENPHFGVQVDATTAVYSTDIPEERIVPLNANNKNPREGSIYLYTLGADGKYYPKKVNVKRFTPTEFDLTDNKDTPILRMLQENIGIMANTKNSEFERAVAKLAIKSILYFPDNVIIGFNSSKTGGDYIYIKNTDTGQTETINVNNPDAVLKTLIALQKFNLRFQISTKKLNDSKYIEQIIQSHILTTDLLYLNNVNTSFEMPLLDPGTNQPINTPEKVDTHTGKKGIQDPLTYRAVPYNIGSYSTTYRVYSDGTIKDGDTIVNNPNLLEEIEFVIKIQNGEVRPIDGNPNLYVGQYSDGISFGIEKTSEGTNRLIRFDELEDKLDSAAKNAERQKKAKEQKEQAKEQESFVNSSEPLIEPSQDDGFGDMSNQSTDTNASQETDDDSFGDDILNVSSPENYTAAIEQLNSGSIQNEDGNLPDNNAASNKASDDSNLSSTETSKPFDLGLNGLNNAVSIFSEDTIDPEQQDNSLNQAAENQKNDCDEPF